MLGKRSLLFLVLVSLCQLVVSEKLELNAKSLSANVTVPSERLDLKVEAGGSRDYSSGKVYKFGLLIGGCDVDIVTDFFDSKIYFNLRVNGKSVQIKDLNSIAATKEDLTFTGSELGGEQRLDCSAKFEKVGEKFMIVVKLSDNVPPNLKLKSEAEIYIPENKNSEANLMLLVYIGVPLVCVAIFISIGAAVGFLIWRRRKNARALSQEKENTKQIEAAKAAEDQLAPEQLAAEKLAAEKLTAEKADSDKKSKVGDSNASTKVKKDGSEKKTQSKIESPNQKQKSGDFTARTADPAIGPAMLPFN